MKPCVWLRNLARCTSAESRTFVGSSFHNYVLAPIFVGRRTDKRNQLVHEFGLWHETQGSNKWVYLPTLQSPRPRHLRSTWSDCSTGDRPGLYGEGFGVFVWGWGFRVYTLLRSRARVGGCGRLLTKDEWERRCAQKGTTHRCRPTQTSAFQCFGFFVGLTALERQHVFTQEVAFLGRGDSAHQAKADACWLPWVPWDTQRSIACLPLSLEP